MDYNVQFSENQKKVMEAFVRNEVDESHYSDGSTFYKYSAYVADIYGIPIFNPKNGEETERNIKILIAMVKGLSITPDLVFIYDDKIELYFENRNRLLDNVYDYFNYSLEFANFIDKIDFCTMTLNAGSFGDSPIELEQLREGVKMKKAKHFMEDFSSFNTYVCCIYDWRKNKMIEQKSDNASEEYHYEYSNEYFEYLFQELS